MTFTTYYHSLVRDSHRTAPAAREAHADYMRFLLWQTRILT